MKRFRMAKAVMMLLTLTFFVMGCSKPKPEVTSSDVLEINSQSALGGGVIVSDVSDPVVERGLCWGTQPNPETSGNHNVADGTRTGSFSCEITGLEPNTTYYVRAYAINGAGVGYGTDVTFKTLEHGYVDLGLPSGTLWATCNVGATKPEGIGDYFAWGETQPKTTYNWSTYQYCNGGDNQLTKYCNKSSCGYNGFTDNLTVLQPSDDAATANWGDGWCMPAEEQWLELFLFANITWTTQNGVNGIRITASNGNSLFLPAAGCYLNDEHENINSKGYFWSSKLCTDGPYGAGRFRFYSGSYDVDYNYRDNGLSVRAVRSAE